MDGLFQEVAMGEVERLAVILGRVSLLGPRQIEGDDRNSVVIARPDEPAHQIAGGEGETVHLRHLRMEVAEGAVVVRKFRGEHAQGAADDAVFEAGTLSGFYFALRVEVFLRPFKSGIDALKDLFHSE